MSFVGGGFLPVAIRTVLLAAIVLLLSAGATFGRLPVEGLLFVPPEREDDCTDQQRTEPPVACRLRHSEAIADVRRQVEHGDAVHRDGDSLRIVYRGEADQVLVAGGLVFPLSRIPTTDLWVLRLRLPDLDHLLLSFRFLVDGQRPPMEVEPIRWRGPKAPPAWPTEEPLHGVLSELTIASKALGGGRRITIYEPPAVGDDPLTAVVYLADGKLLHFYAQTLEPLIVSGSLRRILLVGLHAADDSRRGREYVQALGNASGHFAAHQKFLFEEVMPMIEVRYPPDNAPMLRIVFGVSNGADWALQTGLRHPGTFHGIIAFSAGWPIDEALLASTAGYEVAVSLASGTLEAEYHKNTTEVARQLAAQGIRFRHREVVAGHDMDMWLQALPDALHWSLRQDGNRSE